MDIESESHEKVGFFTEGWQWVKSLFEGLKNKVVGVTNKTIKLAQDDPRRVIHSIKMGLALSLVSLVYYFRPLYDGFGVSTMWAVLTVVVVLEFTVGATLGKGLNRAIATFIAGALGVGAHHLANLAGQTGEPMLLGFFVFLIAAAASFSRFFPGIKARYDYGVLIFILTFCLVSVSGYRVEKILELAHQRLLTIIIGSSACVFISIFICPVWAGEELHKLVALNMENLADFLEGFGGAYFENEESDLVSKDDKSFLQRYKSVLNSKTTEELLFNFAKWEPCHGPFRFHHPWKQYLKIGALTRQCAYQLETLNGYINSEIQAPPEFKKKIQGTCTKMSSESGKALRELALGIRTMTHPSDADIHLSNSKTAANDLKTTLKTALPINTDLLNVIQVATVASTLIEMIALIEKIVESVNELAQQLKFKSLDTIVIPETPKLVHRVTIKPGSDAAVPHVVITVFGAAKALNGDVMNSQ